MDDATPTTVRTPDGALALAPGDPVVWHRMGVSGGRVRASAVFVRISRSRKTANIVIWSPIDGRAFSKQVKVESLRRATSEEAQKIAHRKATLEVKL